MGQMCKGPGIKHVVHTLLSGLQRVRTVVSWALAERHQLVLALQWRTLVLKTLGRRTWTCRTPIQQRVLWCTRSGTVFWNLLTLCSPCASLTTRSCHRVCYTESRGMRLTRAHNQTKYTGSVAKLRSGREMLLQSRQNTPTPIGPHCTQPSGWYGL